MNLIRRILGMRHIRFRDGKWYVMKGIILTSAMDRKYKEDTFWWTSEYYQYKYSSFKTKEEALKCFNYITKGE